MTNDLHLTPSDVELLRAFSKLSRRTREIFLIVNCEKETYQEAARRLGMKPKTVRKRLLRVYDMLGRLYITRCASTEDAQS